MKNKMIKILASAVLLFSPVSWVEAAGDTQLATGTDSESERIKGVANFLLDRANENFMYIFEANLRNNRYFEHYFPKTYSYAETGHLRTLLRSGGGIWNETISADMECIVERTTSTIVRKTAMYIAGFADHYNFLLQHMSIEIDGSDYALNVIPLDATPEVRSIINEFYVYTDKKFSNELSGLAQQMITSVGKQAEDHGGGKDNVCRNNLVPADEGMDALDARFRTLKASAEKIKSLVNVFRKYRDQLKLNEDEVLALLRYNAAVLQRQQDLQQGVDDSVQDYRSRVRKVSEQIEQKRQQLKAFEQEVKLVADNREQLIGLVISLYGEQAYQDAEGNIAAVLKKDLPDGVDSIVTGFRARFYNYIEYYFDINDEIRDLKEQCAASEQCDYSNTVRIIGIERILQAAVDHDVFPFRGSFDAKRFNQFQRYMLFFAEISDARSADTVQALLEEVTFPPVSFGKKRSIGEERWLLTAYLGGAAGQEQSAGSDAREFSGLFAPVGLEYTFARHGGYSHSMMLSPVDFAHPINLELEDRDESVRLSDIFVPGIYYSFGLRKLPLTVGFGVNRGKALKGDYSDESRWLIFFSFDMPLLTVY